MRPEEYIGYELSIGVSDGKEEKFEVIDNFEYDSRQILVIAPSKQLEAKDPEPEIYFVEVDCSGDQSPLQMVSDQDDYENLFNIYTEICEVSNEDCEDENCDCEDGECDCDDEEDEPIIFKVKDEEGRERILQLWGTILYEERKFNLCFPADDDSDTVSEIFIFEVADFEEEGDDPEFEKDWSLVDKELAEEVCVYVEGLLEEDENDEEDEE